MPQACFLFRALVVAPLLLAGCETPPSPELRIGLVGVFEGPARTTSGLPAQHAARMAVDELNATGGVLIDGVSHRLRLIERETVNRPDAAVDTAKTMIRRDSIDVLIGPQSSDLAVAVGALADASRIPMIAPMASAPQVTDGRAYVTRLALPDADQGEVLARYAYDSLGLRRAAALFDANSAYGRGIVERFSSTFSALGGRVVGTATYDAADRESAGPVIAQLVRTAPDAVLLPDLSVADSAQTRLFREAGFAGRFIGSDAWDAIALRGHAHVRGSIIVGNWDGRSDREGVRTFRERWLALYLGERPRATGAATYDAIRLIARAAEKSRARTGPAVVRALREGAPFEGAFASYRFDGTGNPVRGVTLLEMSGDSLIFRATLAPRR